MQPWSQLDLRHLTAFRTVAETRSFARAAEQLGYTQPAVSQQVAALEQIVGRRLFERASGRPNVELTAAGTTLVAHVDAVLARLAAARTDLALDDRVLRIGALPTLAARVVPRVVAALLAQSPAARVEVRESAHDPPLLDDIATGALDAAFVMLPVDSARFETLPLRDDPYVLLTPRGWGFGGISALAELDGVPVVGRRSCRCWDFVALQLRAAGVEPNVVVAADDAFSVVGHVASGVGVAIVSQLTVEMVKADDLEAIPLDALMTPRRLALAWSRERTPAPAHERLVDATRGYVRGEAARAVASIGDARRRAPSSRRRPARAGSGPAQRA